MVFAGAALVAAAPAGAAPRIRVDQLGYAPAEAKVAYVLAPRALRGARFTVTGRGGPHVLRGRVLASRGRWNQRFRAVQPLNLSTLQVPGRYRVRVGRASSPAFRIAAPADLFGPRVAESVAFFQAQRDGPDVIPGPLHRQLDDGSMLLQVGIGSGNKAGTFNGDHDVWRLPEKDDDLTGARNHRLHRDRRARLRTHG